MSGTELYRKYRPQNFGRVLGQTASAKVLHQALQSGTVPHAILFSGPSGCGKTTMARIVAAHLGAEGPDLREVNCADFRGVDMVRDMRNVVGMAPLKGKARVWIIDECHSMTKDAQNAILKLLEDAPAHAYFFLCTTEASKLLKTIRTRCTGIEVKPLSNADIKTLVTKVAELEQRTISELVCGQIVATAEGSARKALVLLDTALRLDSEDLQLSAIAESEEGSAEAFDLAKALFARGSNWAEVASKLRDLQDDPEKVRYVVLGYANKVLCSPNAGDKSHAANVIQAFQFNFYDSKKAGLALACYTVKAG